MLASTITPYANWLNAGDNSWQMTAATFVGLMSVPGLVILYGGVMQKRWSVNSMMLTFIAFAVVLVAWVLWAFKMGFGSPVHLFGGSSGSFFSTMIGNPGSVLGHVALQHQAYIPLLSTGVSAIFGSSSAGPGFIPSLHFPESSLVYFQFVFAAITPILMLGSVLGRINYKAWIPFVLLWTTFIYAVDAFLIWGGGYFGAHGALDYSGGYVIHLSAGVSGFVAAFVIGPRLKRDREVDAPNNLLMVAAGAGLLWLGWNGFNGGDPYFAGASASAAVLNTNLATAVAMLVWVAWDLIFKDKPSLIGTVNGMITGLVAITPAAGYVNGYGAIIEGVVAATVVWMSIRYLSRTWLFRKVDDTLGVIYTHGIAGLTGGLLVGLLSDPHMNIYHGLTNFTGLFQPGGNATLLRWQAETGLWVILFSGIGTFILLKLVGLVIPLRATDEELEIGDHAIHGHEVYPADVASLGSFGSPPLQPAPATGGGG
jgi:ammonium transporter, Amt family